MWEEKRKQTAEQTEWNMQAGYFQQEETEEDTLFLCSAVMQNKK